eukprot:g45295.t1
MLWLGVGLENFKKKFVRCTMDFVSASQPRILDTAACAFRTCCRFLNISMLSSAVRRQLPTASLDERDAFQFRYSLGVEARDLGVAKAARKCVKLLLMF